MGEAGCGLALCFYKGGEMEGLQAISGIGLVLLMGGLALNALLGWARSKSE